MFEQHVWQRRQNAQKIWLYKSVKDYKPQNTGIPTWPTFNAYKESQARLRSCANCTVLSPRRTSALLKPHKEDKEAVKTHGPPAYKSLLQWVISSPFACRLPLSPFPVSAVWSSRCSRAHTDVSVWNVVCLFTLSDSRCISGPCRNYLISHCLHYTTIDLRLAT